MREKIARAMATVDGYEFDKLAPINCVVSPRMNGKDHWFKLADAVLALIEPVMEENERVRGILTQDEIGNPGSLQGTEQAEYDKGWRDAMHMIRATLSLKSEK
jgi:hypothetical protein